MDLGLQSVFISFQQYPSRFFLGEYAGLTENVAEFRKVVFSDIRDDLCAYLIDENVSR